MILFIGIDNITIMFFKNIEHDFLIKLKVGELNQLL